MNMHINRAFKIFIKLKERKALLKRFVKDKVDA